MGTDPSWRPLRRRGEEAFESEEGPAGRRRGAAHDGVGARAPGGDEHGLTGPELRTSDDEPTPAVGDVENLPPPEAGAWSCDVPQSRLADSIGAASAGNAPTTRTVADTATVAPRRWSEVMQPDVKRTSASC